MYLVSFTNSILYYCLHNVKNLFYKLCFYCFIMLVECTIENTSILIKYMHQVIHWWLQNVKSVQYLYFYKKDRGFRWANLVTLISIGILRNVYFWSIAKLLHCALYCSILDANIRKCHLFLFRFFHPPN